MTNHKGGRPEFYLKPNFVFKNTRQEERKWKRFWSKVKPDGDCWIWTAALKSNGYGFCRFNNRQLVAHRLSYWFHKGNIPDGHQLDHLCRRRNCVNPDHLEPVLHKENVLRGENPWAKNARKTHCPRGHEYTDETTYRYKNGRRECRICRNLRGEERRRVMKEARQAEA